MNRRSRYLLALILLVSAGTAAYLVLTRDEPPTGSGGLSEVYGPLIEAKEALLATPHEVDLDLSVDIPEGSEVDNPDHQEISAGGTIDLSAGDAQLVYDYQGLANAAGFLGHFDTMDAIYVGGTGYLKIFENGPPWLSIEPADATNDEVQRLRDVMLTTPMILPGLLEAAASSPLSSHELSREVTPSSLATARMSAPSPASSVREQSFPRFLPVLDSLHELQLPSTSSVASCCARRPARGSA